MAWLEAHDELLNHPKTAALSASMGWSKFETVGRMIGFWWWCLKYAPTGDLRKFNDAALASSVELNGDDAQRWVQAMVEACWLDRSKGTFRVHDWPQYTKRFLRDSRFKGRPDKWVEVKQVYSDMEITDADEGGENSRGTRRATHGVTRATNQPNQPTNKGRLSAEQKTKEAVLNALNGSK